MKDISVFASVNEPCVPAAFHGDPQEMQNMQSCRIPSLITADAVVIAACDKANCGADWGFIEVAVRRSEDAGKTFGKMQTVFTPPARIAPKSDQEYTSSFAIDPVMVQAKDGTILLLFDFYPESKGLHKPDLLVKSTGFHDENGTWQRILLDADGRRFLSDEKGYIYNEKGERTNFYLPMHHNPAFAYQTIGDMYRFEKKPAYLETYPPLFPDGAKDEYAGNIFLKRDAHEGKKAQKRLAENSLYRCIESTPAPLTVPPTSYLWIMKSRDGGKTWSQPEDITPQVKTNDDEPFFGVGPGRGVCLENGRLLIPAYSIGSAYILYSDDNGETWRRTGYCENLDECQLAVYSDGVVGCFGRPEKAGNIPYSISFDGGISWKSVQNELYSVRCQHSVLEVPRKLYTDRMDKSKDYILCARPTGHGGLDESRTAGKAALGEVQADYTIQWISEMAIKRDPAYEISPEYHDFFAYSCMTQLPDGRIGILYEAFPCGYIAFSTFSLCDFFRK